MTTGRLVWYEHLTTDPKAAIAFYTEVLGWTTQAFGDDYTMFVGSQGPLGSVGKQPMTPHDPQQAGEFSWSELYAADHVAAFEFYRQIAGWEKLRSRRRSDRGATTSCSEPLAPSSAA